MENYLAAYVESIAKQRHRNVEWAQEAVRTSQAVTVGEGPRARGDRSGREQPRGAARGDRGTRGRGRRRRSGRSPSRATSWCRSRRRWCSRSSTSCPIRISPSSCSRSAWPASTWSSRAPGLILPGAVGRRLLLLLGFSMQILPFSWVGAVLVLVGSGAARRRDLRGVFRAALRRGDRVLPDRWNDGLRSARGLGPDRLVLGGAGADRGGDLDGGGVRRREPRAELPARGRRRASTR